MRLTRKKALEISIALWTWIADNPGKDKGEWPGWNKDGIMYAACPLCECGHWERYKNKKCRCVLNPKHIAKCGCFDTAYMAWDYSDEGGGHVAAVEFLAQLKALK